MISKHASPLTNILFFLNDLIDSVVKKIEKKFHYIILSLKKKKLENRNWKFVSKNISDSL